VGGFLLEGGGADSARQSPAAERGREEAVERHQRHGFVVSLLAAIWHRGQRAAHGRVRRTSLPLRGCRTDLPKHW